MTFRPKLCLFLTGTGISGEKSQNASSTLGVHLDDKNFSMGS